MKKYKNLEDILLNIKNDEIHLYYCDYSKKVNNNLIEHRGQQNGISFHSHKTLIVYKDDDFIYLKNTNGFLINSLISRYSNNFRSHTKEKYTKVNNTQINTFFTKNEEEKNIDKFIQKLNNNLNVSFSYGKILSIDYLKHSIDRFHNSNYFESFISQDIIKEESNELSEKFIIQEVLQNGGYRYKEIKFSPAYNIKSGVFYDFLNPLFKIGYHADCCGVSELYNFSLSDINFKYLIDKYPKEKLYNLFLNNNIFRRGILLNCYLVENNQESSINFVKECLGFKPGITFKNANSGYDITNFQKYESYEEYY